jgi:hypothetical protein
VRERDVEKYLCLRVEALGGEVRKVEWVGRRGAPDRLVLLPRAPKSWGYGDLSSHGASLWVELKRPKGKVSAPQAREHARLRAYGEHVMVLDSFDRVDEALS